MDGSGMATDDWFWGNSWYRRLGYRVDKQGCGHEVAEGGW
jgi:hypothetical protein